uniref:Reverse transcriptase zinc-binding domain-containing protein n=1 Tax=Cannabis sativa TaxID=3483 RepID=A0A803P7U3_CANSA
MFLWKLCRDIIPFGNRLQRIFGNDTRCAICGEADDLAQHLFFKCPLAKTVWFASRWALRSDSLRFDSPRNMMEWLLSPDFLQGTDEDDFGEFVRFGIYLFDALWTARNRAFHDHISPTWLWPWL